MKRLWMKQHPGRRLTRHQFGSLLNQAWGKSATSENATSGFRATGVFPLNPGAIPEYAFGSNLEALGESQRENLEGTTKSAQQELGPSTSKTQISYYDKPTPTKVLNEISPLPSIIKEACKRAKQVSMLLTSEDHIAKRKIKEKEKEEKLKRPKKIKQEIETDRNKENKTVRKRKAIRRISDSNCEEVPLSLCDTSESENDNKEEDNCRGCGENYYKTQLVEDWLKCNICMLWTHENCTEFEDMCSVCGNKKKKELKGRNGKGKGKKSTGYHSPTPMAIIPGQSGRDGQS